MASSQGLAARKKPRPAANGPAATLQACRDLYKELKTFPVHPRVLPRELAVVRQRGDAPHDALLLGFFAQACAPMQQRTARKAVDALGNLEGTTVVLTARLDFDAKRVDLGVASAQADVVPLLDVEGLMKHFLAGDAAEDVQAFGRETGVSDAALADASLQKAVAVAYALKVSLDALPGWTAAFAGEACPFDANVDVAQLVRQSFAEASRPPAKKKKLAGSEATKKLPRADPGKKKRRTD
ncbi:hypothetical protein M885DRAFT_552540 [Pelagophyceae sp. CCMP2097]|nr:hypothetical protein M885DRAFT_552540 [Pelagophyceae sp. CCMP2097]